MAIDPIQLILEPSIKRRNGCNYEVYDKKRKYGPEQKMFDEDHELLEKKINIFYDKLKYLLYANEIHSFNEKIQNIYSMYDLIDVNKNYLIEYLNNDCKHNAGLFKLIIQKGHILLTLEDLK